MGEECAGAGATEPGECVAGSLIRPARAFRNRPRPDIPACPRRTVARSGRWPDEGTAVLFATFGSLDTAWAVRSRGKNSGGKEGNAGYGAQATNRFQSSLSCLLG